MNPYDSLYDPHLTEFFRKKFTSTSIENKNAYRRSASTGTVKPTSYSNPRSLPIRPFTLYKLLVTTADVPDAGTSTTIYVTLKGECGSAVRQKLQKVRHHGGNIDRIMLDPGSTHLFHVIAPDLGTIRSILVEHDSARKEDSWLLESIQLLHPLTRRRYMFLCNHWLSLYKEDGLAVRELFGIRSTRTNYAIVAVTGDGKACGTDSRVYITIYGRTGITPRIELSSASMNDHQLTDNRSPFSRGVSSKFIVRAPSVGALTKIRICQDGLGQNPHWFLERLVAVDLTYPQWAYYFQCSTWLSPTYADGKLSRLLRGFREPNGEGTETQYRLTFFTADLPDAGFTGIVMMKLHGEFGTSNEVGLYSLSKKHGEVGEVLQFDRGSRVEHTLPISPQYGFLNKLTVNFTSRGQNTKWFLNKVIVDDLKFKRVFHFPCGEWLENKQRKHLFCESKRKESIDNNEWIYLPVDIHVSTGDAPQAGTTSRVFLRLHGPECRPNLSEDGQSEFMENSPYSYITPRIWLCDGKFERNDTSYFHIDLLVPFCISPFEQLQVGHDNSGNSPSWYVDKIMIDCPVTGVQQTFVCHRWIAEDKEDGQLEVNLNEEIERRIVGPERIPWLITVNTSDTEQVGAPSNVILTVCGDGAVEEDIDLDRTKLVAEGLKTKENLFARASEMIFRANLIDIGRPFKVRVQIDKTHSHTQWLLERVLLKNLVDKEEYIFDCNRWFSLDKPEDTLVRELPVRTDRLSDALQVSQYRLECYKSSQGDDEMRRELFIKLHGTNGDTGDRWLSPVKVINEEGIKSQVEEYLLEAVDLKRVSTLRIGHKSRSKWYLSHAELETSIGDLPTVRFECHRWLGPGQEFFDLVPSSSNILFRYEIIVNFAKPVHHSSLKCESIRLVGSEHQSDSLLLKSFQKDDNGTQYSTELFCDDLSELEHIIIEPALDEVLVIDQAIVNVPHVGAKYRCKARGRQIKNTSSGQQELILKRKSDSCMKKDIPHEVVIFSANQKSAIECILGLEWYGTPLSRKTTFIPLTSNAVSSNPDSVLSFTVHINDIGPIQKMRMTYRYLKEPSKWFVKQMIIRKPCMQKSHRSPGKNRMGMKGAYSGIDSDSSSGTNSTEFRDSPSPTIINGEARVLKELLYSPGMEHYWFPIETWFNEGKINDQLSTKEFWAQSSDGTLVHKLIYSHYNIKVKTGSHPDAGTNANVYLCLIGEISKSDPLHLTIAESEHNSFTSDQTSDFKFTIPSIGQLESINIWHDNSGSDPCWFLDYVAVKETTWGIVTEYLFPVYQWFSKTHAGGRIERAANLASPEMLERWHAGKDPQIKLARTFDVHVRTGTRSKHRMTATASIRLFDEDGKETNSIHLSNPTTSNDQPFLPGALDVFRIQLATPISLPVTKFRIWHDDKGGNVDWFVDYVEIQHMGEDGEIGDIYHFPCENWLSSRIDDALIERDLHIGTAPSIQNVPIRCYEIRVITGDQPDAGTGANIVLTLYGEAGDSGEIALDLSLNHEVAFREGQIDIFKSKLPDVGKLLKVRIASDSSGPNADWFLSRIEVYIHEVDGVSVDNHVVVYSGKPVLFICEQWLTAERSNCSTEYELFAEDSQDQDSVSTDSSQGHTLKSDPQAFLLNGAIVLPRKPVGEKNILAQSELDSLPYHITVVTGSLKRATTPGPVWICCHGTDNRNSGRLLLFHEKRGTELRKGSMSRFSFDASPINELAAIETCNESIPKVKSGWFLSYVMVEIPSIGKCYRFSCDSWISRWNGDGQVCRKFQVDEKQISKYSPMTQHVLTLKTCDVEEATTDATVFIKLFGEKGTSSEIMLENTGTMLHRGHTVCIKLECEDVGEVYKMRIRQDGHGMNKHWMIHSVSLSNHLGQFEFYTGDDIWLSRKFNPMKQLSSDVLVMKNGQEIMKRMDLKIQVKTSDIMGAGSDAHVFIQLFGEYGNSNEIMLESSRDKGKLFERNSLDEFMIPQQPPVGILSRCRVWHDDAGGNSDWHCEWIDVSELLPEGTSRPSRHWRFNCNRCLSLKNKESQLISTELICDEEYMNHPDRGRIDDFSSIQCVIAESDLIANPRITNARIGDVEYAVEIQTGKRDDAGTTCNCWIQLIGEFGETGQLKLENSEAKPVFATGQLDHFSLISAPVGGLQAIRLGLDVFRYSPEQIQRYSKHASQWYCHTVRVKDPVSRNVYIFRVGQWLGGNDEDNFLVQLTETLPDHRLNMVLEMRTKPVVKYKIMVYTGSKFSAGSDTDAFVTLFGDNCGLDSGRQLLKRHGKNKLKQGQRSEFYFECIELGHIWRLVLEQDSSGKSSNWFVDKVEVINCSTNDIYTFPCQQWLSKTKGDGNIWRELFVTK